MRKATCLALLLFSILACKKNGGNSNCKVASVSLVPTPGTPITVSFTYDDEGKLKFMNNGGNATEFWHTANGLRKRSSTGNGWFYTSTYELNAAGKPLTKKDSSFNGQSLTNASILTFEYDGQGQLTKTFKNNAVQPEDIFTWSGGNLVKYQSGNVVYILDYYTDKANHDFTFIDLQLFVAMGLNPARSKNLLKSLTSGGNQMNFQYEYDGPGNIKKWYASMLGSTDTVITTSQQFICD